MNLAQTAKELNEVLGLEPAIKIPKNLNAAAEKELLTKIKEAATLIDPETDTFTKPTINVLRELEVWPGEKITDLPKDVKASNDLDDLKSIAKSHDEFKPIRKRLPGMFDIMELKEAMLALLGEPIEDAQPEPIEKVEKPAVVKASIKKKTRAATFAEIISENTPRTAEEINDEMIARSPGSSPNGQKGFTSLYLGLLKEMGIISKDSNEKYSLIK